MEDHAENCKHRLPKIQLVLASTNLPLNSALTARGGKISGFLTTNLFCFYFLLPITWFNELKSYQVSRSGPLLKLIDLYIQVNLSTALLWEI